MAHPSGHRKAARLIDLACNLQLPIITFVDTPGAYPDVKSEEEGIAFIMGDLILKMLNAPVPILGFIIGEGGASGALPFTTTDFLYMTDTSYYSLITPEGATSILYKDIKRANETADAMKITPEDMLKAKIIDGIVPVEPEKGNFYDLIQSVIINDLFFSTDQISCLYSSRVRIVACSLR